MPENILDVESDLLEQPPVAGAVDTKPVVEDDDKPDDLKQAVADLARHVQKVTAVPEAKEPELTQEQKDELWAVYNPEKGRPDFIKKFFRLNPEATPEEIQEVKELYADMQKGFVRQAVVGARNLAQMEFDKLREEIKPIQEYVSTARAEATRGRFFKQYSGLEDGKYSKIIDAQARLLADKDFPNEDEYFKALAEGAADVIKGVVPDFDLGAGKTQTKPVKTPKLPRTSAGGVGSTGGGAPAAAESKDQAGSVLD